MFLNRMKYFSNILKLFYCFPASKWCVILRTNAGNLRALVISLTCASPHQPWLLKRRMCHLCENTHHWIYSIPVESIAAKHLYLVKSSTEHFQFFSCLEIFSKCEKRFSCLVYNCTFWHSSWIAAAQLWVTRHSTWEIRLREAEKYRKYTSAAVHSVTPACLVLAGCESLTVTGLGDVTRLQTPVKHHHNTPPGTWRDHSFRKRQSPKLGYKRNIWVSHFFLEREHQESMAL